MDHFFETRGSNLGDLARRQLDSHDWRFHGIRRLDHARGAEPAWMLAIEVSPPPHPRHPLRGIPRTRHPVTGELTTSADLVLQAVATLGEATGSDIVADTGMPKSTVFLALERLRESGRIVRVRQQRGGHAGAVYKFAGD